MRHGIAAIVCLSAALSSASACAMTGSKTALVDCAVIGGEKLPPATGGAAGICAAIREALSASAAGAPVKVRVEVQSNSRLAAVIERGGIVLPTQNMAVSDSQLRRGAIEDFARAIAQAVAKAG